MDRRVDAVASIAFAKMSARITMPAPPPAGVSSTVRCLSVAKSRICTASSDQRRGQCLAGQRYTKRARKHLWIERQHRRAERHRLPPASFGPRGRALDEAVLAFAVRRTVAVLVTDQSGRKAVDPDEPTADVDVRHGSMGKGISASLPSESWSSSMSPPPKFCTAVTLPIVAPVSSRTPRPTRSSWKNSPSSFSGSAALR